MKAISFIIASVLALCFAALSAAFWITELAGQPTWQIGLAVTASVCVSLMAPISAYFMRSYSWLLIVPALIFVGCDIYQNTAGYQTFKGLTISDEVKAAQTRVDTAQKALDELPTPNATGEIRKASTWETVNTTLTTRLEKAETQLSELQKPEAPSHYVAIVMGLIQLALSMFFACIGKRKDIAIEAEVEKAETQPIVQPKPAPVYDPKVTSIMDKIAEKAKAA